MSWNFNYGICGRTLAKSVCAFGLALCGSTPYAYADDCVTPSLIGTVDGEISGAPMDIAIHGTTAYVAYLGSFVEIFDISIPTAPVQVGHLRFPAAYSIPWDLEIHDDKLFVAIAGPTGFGGGNKALRIFDLSNPALPALISDIDTLSPMSVRVTNDIAYSLDGFTAQSKLNILDILDPANPINLSSVVIPADKVATMLDAIGTTVYIITRDEGLRIYDASNPASPSLTGIYVNDERNLSVQVVGTKAYIAAYEGGLEIIDISDPSSPTLIGSFQTDGPLYDVETDGETLYGKYDRNEMVILDVRDPNSIVELGTYTSGAEFIDSVKIVGTTAFSARSGGLEAIDVTNMCNQECLADLTGDGVLNFFDVSAFLSAFAGNDPAVDFNGDGSLNFFDVSLFLGSMSEGCP